MVFLSKAEVTASNRPYYSFSICYVNLSVRRDLREITMERNKTFIFHFISSVFGTAFRDEAVTEPPHNLSAFSILKAETKKRAAQSDSSSLILKSCT